MAWVIFEFGVILMAILHHYSCHQLLPHSSLHHMTQVHKVSLIILLQNLLLLVHFPWEWLVYHTVYVLSQRSKIYRVEKQTVDSICLVPIASNAHQCVGASNPKRKSKTQLYPKNALRSQNSLKSKWVTVIPILWILPVWWIPKTL